MPSLLDELTAKFDRRPWGYMRILDAPENNVTIKYLVVQAAHRTSLQKHEHKDELLFVLAGGGWVELNGVVHSGGVVRIYPGDEHRVTGPLVYLEVSSYDDGTDTIRLEDDYGR